MNIKEHPIYEAIYNLCQEIEKLPASEQQTKIVVMASALEQPTKNLISKLKRWQHVASEGAKKEANAITSITILNAEILKMIEGLDCDCDKYNERSDSDRICKSCTLKQAIAKGK